MADTKLFNIKGAVKEYQSGTVTLEKELQTVIENNMNIFFGVTFLASEYRTTDGGRMFLSTSSFQSLLYEIAISVRPTATNVVLIIHLSQS